MNKGGIGGTFFMIGQLADTVSRMARGVHAAMPERSFALPLGRYSAHELRATGTRAPAALRMTCLADTTVSIIKDMV